MWLAILLVAPVAIIVQAHYVSRQMRDAAIALFPRARPIASNIRRGYLVLSYSIPALLVVWIIYVLIARPSEGGPPSHPAFEYLLVFPFWFATILTSQCLILIAPIHAALAIAERARGPLDRKWRRRYRGLCLAVLAVFAVYMPIRVALDARGVEVREYRVAVADLPAPLEGFKIALIADPQADAFTGGDRIREMVGAVNAAAPDVVLIAGDIITRDPGYIAPAAEALGELRAPHGVLAAIGDHDNFAYRDRQRSVREVREALAAHDIPLLDNQVRRVGDLALIVATHNYINRITDEQARAVVAQAAGAKVKVLVAHQVGPELLAAARAGRVDLYLAGHTHGGQVRPWFYGLDLVAARIESPYITGRYTLDDIDIIVSSGLGMSVMPFRYRAPATAEIIELVRE
jgi:hypothetical protein